MAECMVSGHVQDAMRKHLESICEFRGPERTRFRESPPCSASVVIVPVSARINSNNPDGRSPTALTDTPVLFRRIRLPLTHPSRLFLFSIHLFSDLLTQPATSESNTPANRQRGIIRPMRQLFRVFGRTRRRMLVFNTGYDSTGVLADRFVRFAMRGRPGQLRAALTASRS
jgi:hypothetical protein